MGCSESFLGLNDNNDDKMAQNNDNRFCSILFYSKLLTWRQPQPLRMTGNSSVILCHQIRRLKENVHKKKTCIKQGYFFKHTANHNRWDLSRDVTKFLTGHDIKLSKLHNLKPLYENRSCLVLEQDTSFTQCLFPGVS